MSHKKLGMTKEIMANKVIPFLVPLSIENGLTISQFNAIMAMVKEIISTIETEHRARLEQLNSVRQDTTWVRIWLYVISYRRKGDGVWVLIH